VTRRHLIILGALLAVLGLGFVLSRSVRDAWLAPSQRCVAVDLRALGDFELDPESGTLADVPARFRALDGRRVMVWGLVIPTDGANGSLKKLQVVSPRDGWSAHHPPRLQERIFGTVARGAPVCRQSPAHDDHLYVYGTLHVNVKRVPGQPSITSLYEMDVDRIDTVGSAAAETSLWSLFSRWDQALLLMAGAVIVIALAWGAWTIAAKQAYRDRNAVPCPVCGYDLRASRERCPECGALVAGALPAPRPRAAEST
jgi:hypothetical protein